MVDPQVVGSEQWHQITRALIFLFLFTGLGLTSALGFLFGHAVVPSLVDSGDSPRMTSLLRWLAYPLSAAALALAAYALIRGLVVAFDVSQQIYPRTWI